MVAADLSTSSVEVDQFDTEMRIAAMPRHVVPDIQHVPSCWTALMMALVLAS